MHQLRSLKVTCSGLTAGDTSALTHARQLTALDLSCNPCLSECCMRHLHGGGELLQLMIAAACQACVVMNTYHNCLPAKAPLVLSTLHFGLATFGNLICQKS